MPRGRPSAAPWIPDRISARSPSPRWASGGDEPAADRVAREVDAIAHAELLEHVGPVAVDGLAADHEQLGDLVAGVALGAELEHLELARGQRMEAVVVARAVEVVLDERRDRAGVEERLAPHRGPARRDQV